MCPRLYVRASNFLKLHLNTNSMLANIYKTIRLQRLLLTLGNSTVFCLECVLPSEDGAHDVQSLMSIFCHNPLCKLTPPWQLASKLEHNNVRTRDKSLECITASSNTHVLATPLKHANQPWSARMLNCKLEHSAGNALTTCQPTARR